MSTEQSGKMHIGAVHNSMKLWANVYQTGLGWEVEFVDMTFHKSKEEADEWFADLYKEENYINHRVIEVFMRISAA